MIEALECDGCGARRYAGCNQSIVELREALRTVGWLCRVIDGRDLDICPTCRAERDRSVR